MFITILPALIALISPAFAGEISCPTPAGPFTGDASICHCYNNGFGADRVQALNAINAACAYFESKGLGTKGSVQAYMYKYGPVVFESPGGVGRILIKADWNAGVVSWKKDCGVTSIDLHPDECVHALKPLVDGCNTKRENGKQGGWGNDACIEWTLDPNPQVNNPGFMGT